MSADRRTFLGSGLAMLAASAAAAQDATPFAGAADAPFFPPRERFPLWPGKPPGAPAKPIASNWTMNNAPPNRELWIRGVAVPEVHVYRAARSDGSALLSLPGGGYEFLSVQNEGIDAAERFNAERTTVFVLTYRLPGEGWTQRSLAPLQDAQRAMRLIRSRAGELGIDPARLGVLGFSAGGHLAADLAVSFDEPLYKPVDAA
ncbi:MAG TPA: alpha/beta hydrolase, partial [Sphingomicrobium sp.]